MRKRTEICVECQVNHPDKGRICEKCRYQKRKDYHKQRYQTIKPQFNQYQADYRMKRGKEQPLSRYPRVYQDRLRALEAYGSHCQDCGWDNITDVLQVHHIDRNRTNHDLSNLAILCPTCHMVRHYTDRSGYWTPSKSSLKSP